MPGTIRGAVLGAGAALGLLAACGAHSSPGPADAGAPGAATQEMVFMWSPIGDPSPVGPGTPFEVALMNLDGGAFQQLTRDGTQKFLPHLSPDASKVVYTKFLDGGYGSSDAVAEVAVLDLASGKETLVTSGGDNGYGTWSPDGKRIAYLGAARLGESTALPVTLFTVNLDGTDPQTVGSASGAADDWVWGDIAWSSEDWILFVVGQLNNGAFCSSRIDKIRPDGTARTQVTNGGTSCTPPGKEAIGDADPGWSSDGATIYSSRGLASSPAGPPMEVAGVTERKLYAVSSEAFFAGKPELDLSLPAEPDCVEGVPKGSPDGTRILLFRVCFDSGPASAPGIYATDSTASSRLFVTTGFGPDWNPLYK